MKTGILYGVGVGPGDPELLTIKAVRILREADVIAVPATGEGRRTALAIVAAHVTDKPLLDCAMPMLRDKARLAQNYDCVAQALAARLDAGETVAFITLGDPSIYSTYAYLHRRLRARGYDARLIPGVPSFCAVAAALDTPLCEGSEMLHIIPASHGAAESGLELPGTRVFMKAGREIGALREALQARGALAHAGLVENCGMEGERVFRSMEDFDGKAGYFAVAVVREECL